MTFEEAYQIIVNIKTTAEPERISLIKSLNRVLAEAIVSDTDLPPFDKSAMDGFACRKEDLSDELLIIEEIPAGKMPVKTIRKGECARIMTGGMVPGGADFVLMKEHAIVTGNRVTTSTKGGTTNICRRGEDIKAGDIVLHPGKKILPADMAILAATGSDMPLVFKIPEVAIISTGNELTEPGNNPGISLIRNSNGYQLTGQVLQNGANAHYLGIVRDDKQLLTEKIGSAIDRYPLVLVSGGVSVGDYDYIPGVLEDLNVRVLFHGLKMKPGKHFLLGKKDNHFIAGMPGNPVSSFVIFEVLVRPLLERLMGIAVEQPGIRLPIGTDYSRKKAGTLFFIPVQITSQGTAIPVEYHGSAHIDAYTKADGIMEIPPESENIKKGELVNVRQI